MKHFVNIETNATLGCEAYLRSCIGAFCVRLNPTLEELGDIKTAVSEAVTNVVVHAYRGSSDRAIVVRGEIRDCTVYIDVVDRGCGIPDIEQARRAFYTSASTDERSGLGFTVMETFMDSLTVSNNPTGGVTVSMTKKIGCYGVAPLPSEGDLCVGAQ